MDLDQVRALARAVKAEVAKAIVGQDEAVDLLLTALFCGGHVLLEGPPGAAKTFMAQCFARATSLEFGRIQFTPDLMPGDIIGSSLFDFQTSRFRLVKGPVFCQLLLADEINRTPPKTQAALLEAMQERAVTIDGERNDLGERFTVVATQNPIEHQGTYPLPEAQLDRFLFKHVIAYPSEAEERAVVARHGLQNHSMSPATFGVEAAGGAEAIAAAIAAVQTVRLNEEIVDYVVSLVRATRDSGDLLVGASPRCSTMLARAARAWAVLQGRDYVTPDDVKFLALPTLRHRVTLSPAAEIEGRTADEAVKAVIERTPAPR
ncbi:MAG TPA: MoxR family ATPase [Caulobacteraceae bacterium]